MAAIYAPNVWLRGLLAAVAATVSANVVLGSLTMTSVAASPEDSHPQWRTLKTYRVET
jgi:hypothetical protein